MAFLTSAGAAIGYEGFKLLLKDLYESAKRTAVDKESLLKIGLKPDALIRKIRQYGKVKTLLNLDKAVDLHTFYYPGSVQIANRRVVVDNYDTIQCDRNITLEGVAGQGKSMLMRHLCLQAISTGSYFPVFVELRDVEGTTPIFDAAKRYFDLLSIELNATLWAKLSNSGKLLLLLDGFDEIPDVHRKNVITELEAFSIKYPDLHIVVSSRPNCEIHNSAFFETIKVCDLQGDEYAKVVRKLLTDPKLSEALIEKVTKNKNNIIGILNTPLLVTLLVFTYRTFQEIPSKMAEFYDALFQLLLQRHDGMKPTNTRQRKCKLNDSDCRKLFEHFCFVTNGIPQALNSESGIISAAEEAIRMARINADASLYIDDIVRITCLILKDGDRYRFVHRSVQEYYAACFIAKSAPPIAQEIYSNLLTIPSHLNSWQGELEFLSQIDRYRYFLHYVLPGGASYFPITDLANTEENIATITQIGRQHFNNMVWRIDYKDDMHLVGSQTDVPNIGIFTQSFLNRVLSHDTHHVFAKILPNHSAALLASPFVKAGSIDKTKSFIKAPMSALVSICGTDFGTDELFGHWAVDVLNRLREADAYIKKQSDISGITRILSPTSLRTIGARILTGSTKK